MGLQSVEISELDGPVKCDTYRSLKENHEVCQVAPNKPCLNLPYCGTYGRECLI